MPIRSFLGRQPVKQTRRTFLQWLLGLSQLNVLLGFFNQGKHPIFSGGSEHGDQLELIRNINPLLEKHAVSVYFNGHDHDLQHIVRGSVEYFNTGAGSKVRPPGPTEGSRFYKGTPGFMAVSLGVEKMHVDVIDYAGACCTRPK